MNGRSAEGTEGGNRGFRSCLSAEHVSLKSIITRCALLSVRAIVGPLHSFAGDCLATSISERLGAMTLHVQSLDENGAPATPLQLFSLQSGVLKIFML